MNLPLMPKATAVWLVENTSLSFKQIAEFCGMHELEVKGIADGDVNQSIIGINPILGRQLSKSDILRCENDTSLRLTLLVPDIQTQRKKKKYTPIARRQDKPDAILWFVKNYPSIPDSIIVKMVGTTKATVDTIRNKMHWNMKNIKPRDPVLLGICTQSELEKIIDKFGKAAS